MTTESFADQQEQRTDAGPGPAAPRVHGRPFVKGQSGNPAGRPSRAYKAAYVSDALIANSTVPLTRKAISLALDGDRTALRLCLERIAPGRRERPMRLDLPPIEGTADIASAMVAVVNAAATGAITSVQADAVARMVETFIRAIDAADFERRLQRLEAADAANHRR